jgi:hypothetical protein
MDEDEHERFCLEGASTRKPEAAHFSTHVQSHGQPEDQSGLG